MQCICSGPQAFYQGINLYDIVAGEIKEGELYVTRELLFSFFFDHSNSTHGRYCILLPTVRSIEFSPPKELAGGNALHTA